MANKILFKFLNRRGGYLPAMAQLAGVKNSGSKTGKLYVPYRAAPLTVFMLQAIIHRNPTSSSARLSEINLMVVVGKKQAELFKWRPHPTYR